MSGGASATALRHEVGGLTVDDSASGERKFLSLLSDKLDIITEEITSTKKEFNAYKNEIKSFRNEVTNLVQELERSVKICIVENKDLKKENSRLKSLIDSCCYEMQEIIQTTQYNFIKILNVPYSEEENLQFILEKVGAAIEFDKICEKCSNYFRAKPKSNNFKFPPPILIKFIKDIDKQEFLKKKKLQKTKLNTKLFNDPAKSQIFVNETMSPHNSLLFQEAKRLQQRKIIKYVWFNNNYLKVRVNENSSIMHIRNKDDLVKLSCKLEANEVETGATSQNKPVTTETIEQQAVNKSRSHKKRSPKQKTSGRKSADSFLDRQRKK